MFPAGPYSNDFLFAVFDTGTLDGFKEAVNRWLHLLLLLLLLKEVGSARLRESDILFLRESDMSRVFEFSLAQVLNCGVSFPWRRCLIVGLVFLGAGA